jgi:hypothetical protein
VSDKFFLKEVITRYYNTRSDIIFRKKWPLPSAISQIYQKLTSLCDELIDDRYVETHPWRQYFRTKGDTLIFDIFSYSYNIKEEKGSNEYLLDVFKLDSRCRKKSSMGNHYE